MNDPQGRILLSPEEWVRAIEEIEKVSDQGIGLGTFIVFRELDPQPIKVAPILDWQGESSFDFLGYRWKDGGPIPVDEIEHECPWNSNVPRRPGEYVQLGSIRRGDHDNGTTRYEMILLNLVEIDVVQMPGDWKVTGRVPCRFFWKLRLRSMFFEVKIERDAGILESRNTQRGGW